MSRYKKAGILRGTSYVSTPCGNETQQKRKSATPCKTDRFIIEANEISTYLKKNYVFSLLSDESSSEDKIRVLVTNTQRQVSCTWNLEKLKQRLVKMRALMYSDESELSSLAGEAVFFDPDDTWVSIQKENQRTSPRKDKNDKKTLKEVKLAADIGPIRTQPNQLFCGSPCGGELTATSDMLIPVQASCDSSTVNLVLDSTAHGGMPSAIFDQETLQPALRTTECGVQTLDSTSGPEQNCSSVDLCSHLVSLIQTRANSFIPKETISDKILSECECLKRAVVNILELYTQLSAEQDVIDERTLLDCYELRVHFFQLVSSLKAVHQHVIEITANQDTENNHMIPVIQNLINVVDDFLTACKYRADQKIQDTSAQILDLIYELCRLTGGLVLLTSLPSPICLEDNHEQTLDQLMTLDTKDDTLYCNAGLDLKQVFISGSDDVIKTSLNQSENSISRIQRDIEVLSKSLQSVHSLDKEVLSQILSTINTIKELWRHIILLQDKMNATINSDNQNVEKCLVTYWMRNTSLMDETGGVVSNLQLLIHATESKQNDSGSQTWTLDCGCVRQLGRCARLIKQSIHKVLRACALPDDFILSTTPQLQRETETLDGAGDDVLEALERLTEVIHTHPAYHSTKPAELKRILPAVPGSVIARKQISSARARSRTLSNTLH